MSLIAAMQLDESYLVGVKMQHVEKCWPRRLLHIPTMTSIKRTGISTYNGIQEPSYGILSYTWGRWESRDADPIVIHGTPWRIPAVTPEHFTREMLQGVINQIGRYVDYLWIDIACIDQEDQATKMDEVGRQVGIFAQAQRMYVWLSHLDLTTLQANLNDFIDCVTYLHFMDEDKDPRPAIKHVAASLASLLKDPWFSSLWTLQECTINRSAMILSREGKPIPVRFMEGSFLLNMVANETSAMVHYLGRLEDRAPHLVQDVQSEVESIRLHARCTGFNNLFISNPNVQYELVRYRTSSRLEDRIYGITQIYNLRVGQSLQPDKTFTLDELREQFAEALVAHYPVVSQLFIHTEQPLAGLTWRITEACEVPWLLHGVPKRPPLCSLTLTESKSLYCEGTCCAAGDLDWSLVSQPKAEIFLDRHIEQALHLHPRPLISEYDIKGPGNAGVAAGVLRRVLSAFGAEGVVLVPLSDEKPVTCLLLRGVGPAQWERIGLFIWIPEYFETARLLLEWFGLFQGYIF
jgi:hypothetical protein